MKILIAIISVVTLMSCQTNKKEIMEEKNNYEFYLGTYTDSTSKGIYKFILKNDGTVKQKGLAAVSDNPSFLAISSDKKFLLAVDEINRDDVGNVKSFLITDDSLKLISHKSSGGAHPCFVAVNDSGYVLAANYTGGNIGMLKHNANGELTDILDVQQHVGNGGTERQQGPHAHSVWFEPNSNNIISVDLGTNELLFSHIDTETEKLLPSDPYKITMAPGAGPRHLAFHPNRNAIYVINELDCTVTLLNKSADGKYEMGSSVSTLPEGYTEPNTCADIHISQDGKFLYASNRGHNSIAIFEINLTNGSLKFVAHESTRGNGPRNFSLSPDDNYLLVANQHTKNIVSFMRNKETGLLNFVTEVDAPTPVCIVF